MRKLILSLFCLFLTVPVFAQDDDGMISKKSNYSVAVTIDKLEQILKSKGITIAVRWKHSDRANQVGIPLRSTELLIFGNPKLGSHMFTSKQTAGIDLPMKALAWKDEHGVVWLTYNDPAYIAKRHKITDRDHIVKKMSGALNMFTDFATGTR